MSDDGKRHHAAEMARPVNRYQARIDRLERKAPERQGEGPRPCRRNQFRTIATYPDPSMTGGSVLKQELESMGGPVDRGDKEDQERTMSN